MYSAHARAPIYEIEFGKWFDGKPKGSEAEPIGSG